MNILHTPHHEVFALFTGVMSYLEIGVQEGQSLAAVIRANPGLQRVTLCDDWGSSHGGTGRGDNGHIEILLRHLGFVGKVTYLTGRSQELVPSLNDAFDLVHVDGDHSTEGARSDLENILRVSTHWIVVHDIFFPEVWAAVGPWLQQHRAEFKEASISAFDHGTLVVDW